MGLMIYLNGSLVPEEEAVVSVFDHGLLYGDGVFEGIRVYAGRVFKLAEHVERFYRSAHSILLDVGLTREETTRVVADTCRANGIRDGYVRLVATRGCGDLGLDPKKCPQATVFCIASSIELYPAQLYEQGMAIVTVPTRRNIPEACNPRIKSLNYLNNIMAKIEAAQAGAAEAVMLSADGYVAEATGDNIFIVDKGVLITPPASIGILEGITRNTVMELARSVGLTVTETLFTRHDVFVADECFLTGTAAELIPVVAVDGRSVGDGSPGPVTRDLMARYRDLTQAEGYPIYPDQRRQ